MTRSTRHLATLSPAVSLLLLAVTTSVLVQPASAGTIDPAFDAYLSTLPADQQVSVIIMMADQVPLTQLDNQLRADNATRRERHEAVVTRLQATASLSQPALASELNTLRATGRSGGFTQYWIANLIVAQLDVAAVRTIAARPDVDRVYSNFSVSPMEPVGGMPEYNPADAAAGGGTATPGLRAINAHRVWYELGITGAGRLVCGLDTGVLGSHTALASRWRGNSAPWQEAWLDLVGAPSSFPSDGHGHGTHTLGTMAGLGEATGDTVGVAWGAEWMACNAIDQGVGSAFDNDVITAFEWMADPDGNPSTVDDVPDVVQNSWRINESFPGDYVDCDPRWWAAMDALEAAGCAVVFSAGNEGPGSMTIGSPPDRITTPTNSYAVGAVSALEGQSFPFSIAGFSSRGPSGCDGVTIKPEVSAPGVSVYSTTNNGSYGSSGWSGTSMAGPHVAGIFALMREANPDIDVTTMKEIIIETARDLGAPGEDNSHGHGIPDAFEAVSQVMQGIGQISGAVTHATMNAPIEGAIVTLEGTGSSFTTDENGLYAGFAAAGTYDISASHPAFEIDTQTGVAIQIDVPVVVDFALTPVPNAVPPVLSDADCLIATDDTVGPYVLGINSTDDLGFQVVDLHYSIGAFWTRKTMQPVGNDRFEASIPGQPLGTTVRYYFQATDAAGNVTYEPSTAPTEVASFEVAEATPVFSDDAESDQGWTLGIPSDNATTGVWIRDDPVGTSIQPEDDHTAAGTDCFVTGNAPVGASDGENDVDNGCTTLVSPLFDVSDAEAAVVSYWRWYGNQTSLDDEFVIELSNDGGNSWQELERVGPGNVMPWIFAEHLLGCDIELTDEMQLRFIACDLGLGSLTEAAVDDVSIAKFLPGAASVALEAPTSTGRFRVVAAQPNPFNPFTLITYELTKRESVELNVYDVTGRQVRTLVNGAIDAGLHTVAFDGRNDAGADLASGTYFVKLEADGRRAAYKISLLR